MLEEEGRGAGAGEQLAPTEVVSRARHELPRRDGVTSGGASQKTFSPDLDSTVVRPGWNRQICSVQFLRRILLLSFLASFFRPQYPLRPRYGPACSVFLALHVMRTSRFLRPLGEPQQSDEFQAAAYSRTST